MASERSFTLSAGSKIPALGLGTWRSKPNQVKNAIKTAYKLGYRHFDCAATYENEAEVGEAFTEAQITRNQIWVTSKLWNTEHRAEDVLPACERTLKDLQVEYLDLYLMHWPLAFKRKGQSFGNSERDANGHPILEKDVTPLDTWRAMEKLVELGKAKNIGVSNFSISQLKPLLEHATIRPAVLQIECHPYCPNNELLAFCKNHGIHVTAYSPLGSISEPRVREDPVVEQIAKETGRTPAQVLIAWGLQRGTSVLAKSVTPSRIEENFDDKFTLSRQQMDRISGITTRLRTCDCREEWGLSHDALFDN
ncbi:hypothetical protein IWQ62_000433 [Dispira parvispora]|uniref:NADP-dependent oxidoreductase domain-containing protein n=1 Tax=Dispira parvispora TaxID=1520584 RepID=A0A9W8E617_9FUNG|nr:hypothetical protein IWQ62_000433 [Dispira parvispora]